MNLAEAAKVKRYPEQKLQQSLLEELRNLPQVTHIGQESMGYDAYTFTTNVPSSTTR
jgi:hypothetical protein